MISDSCSCPADLWGRKTIFLVRVFQGISVSCLLSFLIIQPKIMTLAPVCPHSLSTLGIAAIRHRITWISGQFCALRHQHHIRHTSVIKYNQCSLPPFQCQGNSAEFCLTYSISISYTLLGYSCTKLFSRFSFYMYIYFITPIQAKHSLWLLNIGKTVEKLKTTVDHIHPSFIFSKVPLIFRSKLKYPSDCAS